MKRNKDGKFVADSAAVRSAVTARFTEEDKARFVAAAEAMGKAPTILLREIALEWLNQQELKPVQTIENNEMPQNTGEFIAAKLKGDPSANFGKFMAGKQKKKSSS